MHKPFRMVKDAVMQCPLPLVHLQNAKFLQVANGYLPYEVGIEIEVYVGKVMSFDIQRALNNFTIEKKNWDKEITIRIPSGVAGMLQLYKFLEYLKAYCEVNPQSGIHYHIDFTDVAKYEGYYFSPAQLSYICDQQSWILSALDTWNYKGTYNDRQICVDHKKGYVNIRRGLGTLEFRIGEGTFDYSLIMKRIVHLQNICRRIKVELSKL